MFKASIAGSIIGNILLVLGAAMFAGGLRDSEQTYNAAEHASAITAAMKNHMDLSLAIAVGSSVQVALFVAPVLVLASLWVGSAPMDLVFPSGLVVTVLLSVLITAGH